MLKSLSLLTLFIALASSAYAQPLEETHPWACAWNLKELPLPAGSTTIPDFLYDRADTTVTAKGLGADMEYDADLVSWQGGLWSVCLSFTPEEGDRILFGALRERGTPERRAVTPYPGNYANPMLTVDAKGRLWLSFEKESEGQWDVYLAAYDPTAKTFARPERVSGSRGPDTHHRAVADTKGGLWIVWQTGRDGQFDIAARHAPLNAEENIEWVSRSPGGDWHPAAAITKDGNLHVIWDTYNGDNYDVRIRSRRNGAWMAPIDVAHTKGFEGRAQIVPGPDGAVWVAWEEGSENWGHPYFTRHDSRTSGKTPHQEMNEPSGPLHTYRLLRIGAVLPDGAVRLLETPLPMPMAELALQRTHERPGVTLMGAFYERARLTADRTGKIWLTYRHYFANWMGIGHRSHVENGWGLYARALSQDGWSKLYRFDVGQGDGMQRLAIAPYGDGIAAIWKQGRTDRRLQNDLRPRGLHWATVEEEKGTPPGLDLLSATPLPVSKPKIPAGREREESVELGGKEYELFLGDLHRHTDLSLCRVSYDGTLDDAYRYAIDVAKLDFLGVTDHARDLHLGDRLSLLWWRCRKEVNRHFFPSAFLPYYAFERSQDPADHNVIALYGDVLRPHDYPLQDFWQEFGTDVITIPHQPIRTPDIWDVRDELRRPLYEIFQGCRTRPIEQDAHEGFARGHRMGFIASSDHMSTGASFACVWAEERSRESVFRAMQNRRTYAATAKIRLAVTAGDHWMGEAFEAETMPSIKVDAVGTATIETVRFVVDGEVVRTLTPGKPNVSLEERFDLSGEHYVYVHLVQRDGYEAWSSPIWVNVTGR